MSPPLFPLYSALCTQTVLLLELKSCHRETEQEEMSCTARRSPIFLLGKLKSKARPSFSLFNNVEWKGHFISGLLSPNRIMPKLFGPGHFKCSGTRQGFLRWWEAPVPLFSPCTRLDPADFPNPPSQLGFPNQVSLRTITWLAWQSLCGYKLTHLLYKLQCLTRSTKAKCCHSKNYMRLPTTFL